MTAPIVEVAGLIVQPGIAKMHLERYFRPTEGVRDSKQSGFSGRFFESYVAKSRAEAPELGGFTPWEILAVDSLGVQVPAAYVQYLMDPGTVLEHCGGPRTLGTLIAACREENRSMPNLWQGADERPAMDDLYRRVYRLTGMGHVKTSKLLAAKFPDHVPVSDTHVNALLGFSYGSTERTAKRWWSAVAGLLRTEGVIGALELGMGCSTDSSVGLLRRLDVVLWMEHRWRQKYERLRTLLDGRPLKGLRGTVAAQSRQGRQLIRWYDDQQREKNLSPLHVELLGGLDPG
jgi:hypothetical protein